MSSLFAGTLTDVTIDQRGRARLVAHGSAHAARGTIVSPVQRAPASAVQLDWIEQWTAPQRFARHPANPIYGPARSGAWDSWTNGVAVVPFAGGSRYRIYYSGREGEGIGFAEADAADPVSWREHPASPVLQPRPDTWEGKMLNQPRVVALSEDHWLMYYTGWGFPGEGTTWALGLAESRDGGITWARVSDEPILPRGAPGEPDDGAAVVPTIIRLDGQPSPHVTGTPSVDGPRWWMWYTAAQVNAQGHQNIHLCLATSDDCVHWRKHQANPVLTDDFSDGAPRSVTSRCYVRHDHGVFRLWYSFAKPGYRIHYAESLDGIEWERAGIEPVLGPAPAPAWDDDIVEYPEVLIVDGVYRLWYCGNGFGTVGYAEGREECGVRVSVRTGAGDDPDDAAAGAGWTDWQPVTRGDPMAADAYLQVRAELWTEWDQVSPALHEPRLVAATT